MKTELKQVDPRPRAEEVWHRYRNDLEASEAQLAAGITSKVPLVGDISHYVLGSGGKRFRPLLLAASARMAGVTGASRPVAVLGAVVEYIHTATLLHDDVVDEGDLRRGHDAARTLWGNAGSVLVGDYLYARALALAVGVGRLDVVGVLTTAVEEMSEGEVFQLSVCGDASLSEASYLRIVDLKTAALMSAACRLGGMLGDCTPGQLEALTRFGRNIGIAFQVADDTLDYQADEHVFGKALGGDLKDGKITLPMLYALERCSGSDRERLTEILARDEDAPEEDLRFALDLMRQHGALDDALARARDFAAHARSVLADGFPAGEHRASLMFLADYVIERDH